MLALLAPAILLVVLGLVGIFALALVRALSQDIPSDQEHELEVHVRLREVSIRRRVAPKDVPVGQSPARDG